MSRTSRYIMELGGNAIPLENETTVVGRSRDCDLRVEDPAASRRHFELLRREGSLYVKDLGSSNGTYRNGRRVQGDERLADGDVLLVGETEMTIRSLEAEAREAGELSHATVRIPTLSEGGPASEQTTTPDSDPGAGPSTGEGPPAPPPPPAADAAAGAVLPDIGETELGDRAPSPEPEPEPDPDPDPDPDPPLAHPTRTGARPAFLPPAGFWVRVGAVIVDAVAIGLVSFLVALPFGGSAELVVFSLLTWILSVAVPVVGWARWGTTPGKRVFGLVLCTTDGDVGVGWGQAAIRWVGYLLSGLLLGAGFLMVAFTASRRGLHDHLAGTYVGRR